MKRLVILLFGLVGISLAEQVEYLDLQRTTKGSEVGIFLGFTDYKGKALKSSGLVGLSMDYRVKYPFLVGAGVNVGWAEELTIVNPHARLKVRIPLVDRLKLDPYITAGVGYVDKTKKFMGQVSAGFSLIYFFSEVHAGVSFGGSVYTDSKFNQIYAGLLVGF